MRKKQQLTKTGISLIEVCISIVLVLIILISMLKIFSQGYRYLRKDRLQTIACSLAREKMEENSIWPPLDSTEGYGDIVNFPKFRRTVIITNDPIPTLPAGSLKQLETTVYWQGVQKKQSLTLVGLTADF